MFEYTFCILIYGINLCGLKLGSKVRTVVVVVVMVKAVVVVVLGVEEGRCGRR